MPTLDAIFSNPDVQREAFYSRYYEAVEQFCKEHRDKAATHTLLTSVDPADAGKLLLAIIPHNECQVGASLTHDQIKTRYPTREVLVSDLIRGT